MRKATLPRRSIAFILILCAALATLPFWPRAADPDALWTIVNEKCMPDEQAHGDPKPCAAVDLAGGYAILKDLHGVAQYLLIPTARITGIEDPALLRPGAPEYFAAAWSSRTYLEQRLGHALPREDIGLAVNSEYGRSQNQLHIHIDCVRPDVRDALRAHDDVLTAQWAVLPFRLAGHTYRARRIAAASLEGIDPIELVADGIPGAKTHMDRETVAVLGDKSGFVLLADEADWLKLDHASAEEVLDHACAVRHDTGP